MRRVFSFSFLFFFTFFFFLCARKINNPRKQWQSLCPPPLPPTPSLTGNYPNSGIAWDAWYMHLVSFAVRLLRVCIMISTFLAALSAGSCNKHLSLSLSLCPSLCLSLSLSRSVCAPSGVIEIILLQLYQRGNPNDKYINKLQARCDSPQLGTAFSFGAHFSTFPLDTFHLALSSL